MITLPVWILIFLVSLFVLVKSSDYFTIAAERIGLHFKIPPFIIGVTIVAVGTSIPELVISIFSVIQNTSEIVVGNVIGSNIANIAFILGIGAVIARKIRFDHKSAHIDAAFLVASSIFLAITIWDGEFSWPEALIAILGMAAYLQYVISQKSVIPLDLPKHDGLTWKDPSILILSLAFLLLGAKYTISSMIEIAAIVKIGAEAIAATAVALGTSLPELAVTVHVARKGKVALLVGNLLGSNVFNTFIVMGIPGLITTLTIPPSIITFALPVMIAISIVFFFLILKKEIPRWQGYLLIVFYLLFVGKVLNLF